MFLEGPGVERRSVRGTGAERRKVRIRTQHASAPRSAVLESSAVKTNLPDNFTQVLYIRCAHTHIHTHTRVRVNPLIPSLGRHTFLLQLTCLKGLLLLPSHGQVLALLLLHLKEERRRLQRQTGKRLQVEGAGLTSFMASSICLSSS